MLKAVKTMPDRVSRMSPRPLAAVLAVLCLCLGLSACADSRPPTGRWEGLYEDAGVIIVARLEIADNGKIRVSAPNAITGEQPLSPAERASVVQQLQARLATSWPAVEPLPLEFDGQVFRKPGGVAPQLDVYALVRDAVISVLTFTPMMPMAVGFPTNINLALLLAGLFTILVARIVDEAVLLADEVRGTI